MVASIHPGIAPQTQLGQAKSTGQAGFSDQTGNLKPAKPVDGIKKVGAMRTETGTQTTSTTGASRQYPTHEVKVETQPDGKRFRKEKYSDGKVELQPMHDNLTQKKMKAAIQRAYAKLDIFL